MINLITIPVGTASATSQELLVEITEPCCKPYCANGQTPSASVAFTAGAVTIVNGNAVVPVTATVTVISPNGCTGGCAHTQIFTEVFHLAFQTTTDNTVTLTQGDSTLVTPANVKCCKARSVMLTTSLTATIA